jgi:queuine/archaeosine tRNA-ribosyltransferase
MQQVREAIMEDRLLDFKASFFERYYGETAEDL